MPQKLQDKVAIVTGASKGIGASIAKNLALEGASVVVNYSSDKAGADRVVEEIKSKGGKAIAVHANMTSNSDLKQLFAETHKAFNRLDILVNNAGVYEFLPLEKITRENFYKMFDINVLALILATQESISHFGEKGGSIINISSLSSKISIANASVYSATKASVDKITQCLAKELGHLKIRVNAVNPGMVETEGTDTGGFLQSDLRKEMENNTPLGHIGKPEDISPAVVFLASDDSSWITGETFVISGGYP